jgi:hypothetical protein
MKRCDKIAFSARENAEIEYLHKLKKQAQN